MTAASQWPRAVRPSSAARKGNPRRLARLPYSAIEARAVMRAFDGASIIELAGLRRHRAGA